MPRVPGHAGIRRAVECHVAECWRGPPVACGGRRIRKPADGRWLRLTVRRDHVVVECHAPRAGGAAAALALADRVAALFRGRAIGSLRFASASVDLDGRDPEDFRVVVRFPVRQGAAATHAGPPPAP